LSTSAREIWSSRGVQRPDAQVLWRAPRSSRSLSPRRVPAIGRVSKEPKAHRQCDRHRQTVGLPKRIVNAANRRYSRHSKTRPFAIARRAGAGAPRRKEGTGPASTVCRGEPFSALEGLEDDERHIMPAVWNRHERCGAHRANFGPTGTDCLRMPQLRVCDERAVGADGAQGQIPAAEECLGSALRSLSK
jgi:hypothetical protein